MRTIGRAFLATPDAAFYYRTFDWKKLLERYKVHQVPQIFIRTIK
ncbi:MAG: hypothetical protein ACREIG_06460 [Nitrospiraceae bacterium]